MLLNQKKKAPLFLAIQNGLKEIAKTLILKGADITCCDIIN